jgi:hypothetical protein
LSPVVRISGYLAAAGFDFSYFGLSGYAFGSVILCSLENIGVDYGFVPIPSISNSSMLLAIGKRKTKYFKSAEGKIIENVIVDINCTIDHRFFDGSYAAKLNAEFKRVVENLEERHMFTNQLN